MLISYKRASNMKLEYQISQLGRGDSWHCNFCSFESNKNSIATYEMVAYNTKTSGYNDIAYICVECKGDLDNGTLPLLRSVYSLDGRANDLSRRTGGCYQI